MNVRCLGTTGPRRDTVGRKREIKRGFWGETLKGGGKARFREGTRRYFYEHYPD